MNFDIMKLTTNRTISESRLTTNLIISYSEKAFAGNFRFPIRGCFGSAEGYSARAFSFGVKMAVTNKCCKQCGKEFKSYQPKPTFCSKKCKSDSQTITVDLEKLAELYQSGLTQSEIAEIFGTTQKVIFNAMQRNGIKARVAAKRNQFGELNHQWKGDEATKSAMHIRLYKRFGQPKKCEICGTEDETKSYDWANLTGHYEDETDYKRMCRSCHWKFDEKHKNWKGAKGFNERFTK